MSATVDAFARLHPPKPTWLEVSGNAIEETQKGLLTLSKDVERAMAPLRLHSLCGKRTLTARGLINCARDAWKSVGNSEERG